MAILDLDGASMLWPLHRRAPRPMVWDPPLEATDLLEPWIAVGHPRRAATRTDADDIERARRRKSLGSAGPGEMLMPYGRLGRDYRNGIGNSNASSDAKPPTDSSPHTQGDDEFQ
jgi:hypothetical protein